MPAGVDTTAASTTSVTANVAAVEGGRGGEGAGEGGEGGGVLESEVYTSACMMCREVVSAASNALAAFKSETARALASLALDVAAVSSKAELIPPSDVADVDMTCAVAGVTVRVADVGALR